MFHARHWDLSFLLSRTLCFDDLGVDLPPPTTVQSGKHSPAKHQPTTSCGFKRPGRMHHAPMQAEPSTTSKTGQQETRHQNSTHSRTVRRPSYGRGQPAKDWPRSVLPLLCARLLVPASYPGGRPLLLTMTSFGGYRHHHRHGVRRLRARISAFAASSFGVRIPRLSIQATHLPPAWGQGRSATPRRSEMITTPLLAHWRCRTRLAERREEGEKRRPRPSYLSST